MSVTASLFVILAIWIVIGITTALAMGRRGRSAPTSLAVREHLGMRGYFLQLKIERCTDVAGLLELLPELSSALGHVHDLGFADDFERRLRAVAQA